MPTPSTLRIFVHVAAAHGCDCRHRSPTMMIPAAVAATMVIAPMAVTRLVVSWQRHTGSQFMVAMVPVAVIAKVVPVAIIMLDRTRHGVCGKVAKGVTTAPRWQGKAQGVQREARQHFQTPLPRQQTQITTVIEHGDAQTLCEVGSTGHRRFQ